MPQWDRSQWRAAERIVEALLALRAAPTLSRFPDQQIHTLHRLRQRWHQAIRRGWLVAAAATKDTWELHLRWLINDLTACRTYTPPATALTPTTAQVYRDLLALHDEFELVDVDPQTQTVTVHTDRIVLQDLDLGPFALVWNWSPDENRLRVIAQDARYADQDENIPHPHVRDEELCVGEGEVALHHAFRSGRLLDAFLIVRQILQTYNPDSAYASLGRSTGHSCCGCASDMEGDEGCSCEGCGENFCRGCTRSCGACGHSVCHDCSTICPDCGNRICPTCRTEIDAGRRRSCPACEDDATLDEEPDDDVAEAPTASESDRTPTDIDVHTDRLGEAALSAGPG